MSLKSFVRLFVVAWSVGRVLDAGLTWYILRAGLGYEKNPLASALISVMGLEAGLIVFAGLGIAAGVVVALVVPRLLECRWCRTKFDEAVMSALGVEGVAKVILATALGISLVPVFMNALCMSIAFGWLPLD